MKKYLNFLYRNVFASVTSGSESYLSVNQGEESIIAAATYVISGMEFSTALSYNNVSGTYNFTTKFLYAQSFLFRISSVSCRSLTFLMCHNLPRIKKFFRFEVE